MLVMLGFSFFWNAALQFEVITLNHLGAEIHRYSRVRLWGSVGFIVAAVGVGFLVERWGVGLVPALLWGAVRDPLGQQPASARATPGVQVRAARRWARCCANRR